MESHRRLSLKGTHMKKAIIGICLLIVLLAGAGFAYVYFGEKTYQLRITNQEIQEKVDQKFPITKTHLVLFKVTWKNPKVVLVNGSERVTVSFDAEIHLRDADSNVLRGTCQVTSALNYKADKYEFYLVDPKIEQLDIQGVPAKMEQKVTEVFNKYANEVFDQFPVYKIRGTDRNKVIARMVLKKVTVENGDLVITLGL
jgi:hypothetical protein